MSVTTNDGNSARVGDQIKTKIYFDKNLYSKSIQDYLSEVQNDLNTIDSFVIASTSVSFTESNLVNIFAKLNESDTRLNQITQIANAYEAELRKRNHEYQTSDAAAKAKSTYQTPSDDAKLFDAAKIYSTTVDTSFIPKGTMSVSNVNFAELDAAYDLHGVGSFTRDKRIDQFTLPGYRPCYINISVPVMGKDSQILSYTNREFVFLISPDQMSETRTNNVVPQRTGGGYFVYRTGPGLTQLTISGYMLDTLDMRERTTFLEAYFKPLISDQISEDKPPVVGGIPGKGSFQKYVNDNRVDLTLEGYRYSGHIVNITLNKSALQQFLYRYTITMLVMEDKHILPMDIPAIQAYTRDAILVSLQRKFKLPVTINLGKNIVNIIIRQSKSGTDTGRLK